MAREGRGVAGERDSGTTQTCRCEEVLLAEVIAAIAAGAASVDDVKRRTRAGMGACQGIYCVPAIAAIIAQATATPIERVGPMTARPPLRPIPLEALAALRDGDASERLEHTGDES
jgi:NAD(P)H-nitrite reductase large subunit